jgi:hypothetical protein
MECLLREGTKGCVWWMTGCLNPHAKPDVKKACASTAGQLDRQNYKSQVQL